MGTNLHRFDRPYKIKQKDSENELKLQAVTMIDPATGWFEIHEYDDKRAITIANIARTTMAG